MIHWSSGREGHNNYRRDLVIWLVHLIYTVQLAKVALCYNYVILNYCIRFAVLPCVRLCLNYCLIYLVAWLLRQELPLIRIQRLHLYEGPRFLVACHQRFPE